MSTETPRLSAAGVCKQCRQFLQVIATPAEIAAGATEEHVLAELARRTLEHLAIHSLEHGADGKPVIVNGQPVVIPDGPHAILGEVLQLVSETCALRYLMSMDPRVAAKQAENIRLMRAWLEQDKSSLVTPAGTPANSATKEDAKQ